MEEQYSWISIVLIAVKNLEHNIWDLLSFLISRSVELCFRTEVGTKLPFYDA